MGNSRQGSHKHRASAGPPSRFRKSPAQTTTCGIRPPQLKRAVSFYEEQATRMLVERNERNETRTTISVANGRSRNR